MKEQGYVGVRDGDLADKPYAKYWKPKMDPMPDHITHALHHGAESAEFGFTTDKVDIMAEPGYLPLENGYTTLPNGQVFVAVLTEMPRATGAMMDWWMGWHYMEAQRYKLWHPRSHVLNRTEEMIGDDPDKSDKEKYLTTHYVTEYIANRREDITITFAEPTTWFSDLDALAANGITASICGQVGIQGTPITIGHLLHQIREVPGGSEMRSRFWIGKPELANSKPNGLINRFLGSKLFAKIALPKVDIGREMVVHCAMEMNHLAKFLPELYYDYHPDAKTAAKAAK